MKLLILAIPLLLTGCAAQVAPDARIPVGTVNETAIYDQGYSEGYRAGVASVQCPPCKCPEIKWYNPTRTEVEAFIRQDDTQKLTTGDNCLELASMIVDKARAMGWNAAMGAVYFDCYEEGHAFALFNTSDSGILFVDPFTDIIYPQEMMQEGKPYPPNTCRIYLTNEYWYEGQLE